MPEELELRKGDEILVTGDAEDGWFYGECRGKSGTFPRGFVALLPESDSVDPPVAPQSNGSSDVEFNLNNPHGIALYDYRATHADELDLHTGQTVRVLRHVNHEWIEGETTSGRKGMFPASYVQIVNDCDKPERERISKELDLLLDFDPLLTGLSTLKHNAQPISTLNDSNSALIDLAPPLGSKYMNLDHLIARNLNQLESKSETAPKQRPSSWSQELTKLQLETFSRSASQETASVKSEPAKLPKIPPRLHEIHSVTRQQREQSPEPEPEPEPERVNAEPVEQVPDALEYANTIGTEPHAVSDVSDAEHGISAIHNGGAVRRSTSYIRPAPPPPTHQTHSPTFERQHSTGSNEGCLRPHRPAPCIPIDGNTSFSFSILNDIR